MGHAAGGRFDPRSQGGQPDIIMAKRGQPSTAHEFDKRGQCLHCWMYKINVETTSHVCTPAREKLADEGRLVGEGGK